MTFPEKSKISSPRVPRARPLERSRVEGDFNFRYQHQDRIVDRTWGGGLVKPSIDRIDSTGDYTFENCRFIELEENQALGRANMRARASSAGAAA